MQVGEEEQQNRPDLRKKSRSKRYDACSDVEHRNTIDAAASRSAPKTKSQPSASGCDLKRRGKADFAPMCNSETL